MKKHIFLAISIFLITLNCKSQSTINEDLKKQLEKSVKLSHLELPPKEKKSLLSELEKILHFVKIIATNLRLFFGMFVVYFTLNYFFAEKSPLSLYDTI